MQTFKITEAQNASSQREGYTTVAKDLAAAKRTATRNQAFYGTVLRIEDGGGRVLSIKQSGKWEDQ